MSLAHSPRIVTSNLTLSLDFASLRNFNPSSNGVAGISSGRVVWEVVNPQYVNFDYTKGAVIFTRDLSVSLNVAQKNVAGGCVRTNANLYNRGANNITYTGFYYQDHTFEVWFQINNSAPSQYDPTETNSVLVGHRGYNNGFNYSSSQLKYIVWSGTTQANTIMSWSIGASSEIKTNQWYQIVATRNGTTWTKYLNGVRVSTATDNPPINTLNNFQGEICLGASWRPTTNFQAFGINTVSAVRMYNRALTDEEILQNFNAYRTRFGI